MGLRMLPWLLVVLQRPVGKVEVLERREPEIVGIWRKSGRGHCLLDHRLMLFKYLPMSPDLVQHTSTIGDSIHSLGTRVIRSLAKDRLPRLPPSRNIRISHHILGGLVSRLHQPDVVQTTHSQEKG